MSRGSPKSSERRDLSERWIELVAAVDAAAQARADGDADGPGVELARFELLEFLGGGGMGVVFLAQDSMLGREVALKLWKLPRDEAEAAVLHEARCLAKLSHPNVVAIYDTGKVEDDVFLTMEYVDGVDGRDWISSFRVSWEQVVDFYVGAGQGLAAAHAAGLVHGDFKPENVLLGRDHFVRVADFGVARALREHADVHGELGDEESEGRGTLGYMAPERLQGRHGDERADQFAFCVTLWECLYGSLPFLGTTPVALLEAMEAGELAVGGVLPGIPRRLKLAMERGLALDPRERWPNMAVLLGELRQIRQVPQRRRRRFRGAAAAVGLALVSSGLTLALIAPRSAEKSDDVGITPREPATTPEPVDETTTADETGSSEQTLTPEAEILAEIAAGKIDGAAGKWSALEATAWAEHQTIEHESLTIAEAFIDKALEIEHSEPRSAALAAGYARQLADYIRGHASSEELDAIAERLERIDAQKDRLVSRRTTLLGAYTAGLKEAATLACECQGFPGLPPGNCLDSEHPPGPEAHACLADLLAEEPGPLGAYLECVVPVGEELVTCIDGDQCGSEEVQACLLASERAQGNCETLAPELAERFAGCIVPE